MVTSSKRSRIDGDRPTAARRESAYRLLAYVRSSVGTLMLGLLCSLVVSGVTLSFARLLQTLADASLKGSLRLLNQGALILIGLMVVKWLFQYGQLYFINRVGQALGRDLRTKLFAHLQNLPIAFFDRRRSGHLMSVMANDIMVVQSTAGNIGQWFAAPFTIVGAVVWMFMVDWQLTIFALACLPIMFLLINATGRRMRTISSVVQMQLADLSRVTEETVAGARVVKTFGMEDQESERFDAFNWRAFGAAMKGVQKTAVLTPTIELLGACGIAFILWYVGRQVASGATTFPSLLKYLTLLWAGVYQSLRNLGNMQVGLQRALAAADRVFELMDQEPEVREPPGAIALDGVRGEVTLEDVGFAYAGEERVLDDVSFRIDPGKTVALVGPSGAGKTTIASLLPRFYDVQSGAIRIDGVDIRQVTLKSLRGLMAIVPQETILFGGTVRENIAYGKPEATAAEIEAAARTANAHSFILDLPDGYDTIVGDRGCLLSGGQRQRIAIARALLRDPKILILDEATSSLDAESEVLVQEALDHLMTQRTTLVIAHRLSTVKRADTILVLDHGRIVESGTHAELVRRDGLYRRLSASQLGGGDDRDE
jgi:subfamily B ATP-binding cassette protein MsbA